MDQKRPIIAYDDHFGSRPVVAVGEIGRVDGRQISLIVREHRGSHSCSEWPHAPICGKKGSTILAQTAHPIYVKLDYQSIVDVGIDPETTGRGACDSGRVNMQRSVGGGPMLTSHNTDPNEKPRLLGVLGDVSHAKVSSSEFKYRKDTEIFGQAEPADYIYQVIEGAVRSHMLLSDGRRQ